MKNIIVLILVTLISFTLHAENKLFMATSLCKVINEGGSITDIDLNEVTTITFNSKGVVVMSYTSHEEFRYHKTIRNTRIHIDKNGDMCGIAFLNFDGSNSVCFKYENVTYIYKIIEM